MSLDHWNADMHVETYDLNDAIERGIWDLRVEEVREYKDKVEREWLRKAYSEGSYQKIAWVN